MSTTGTDCSGQVHGNTTHRTRTTTKIFCSRTSPPQHHEQTIRPLNTSSREPLLLQQRRCWRGTMTSISFTMSLPLQILTTATLLMNVYVLENYSELDRENYSKSVYLPRSVDETTGTIRTRILSTRRRGWSHTHNKDRNMMLRSLLWV